MLLSLIIINRRLSLFAKRNIVSLVLVLACLSIPAVSGKAQSQYTTNTKHYLTLSAAAGLGVDLSGTKLIRTGVGMDGQAAFSYEVANRGFFFSFGVGTDYRLSENKLAGTMVHAFNTADRDGNPIIYRYVYSKYQEIQHTIYASVPIWFGYTIRDKVYFAVGAKASLPLWNTCSVAADMYTEGEYINLIEAISRNVPDYGFYPMTRYTGSTKYTPATVYVSPMVEVGGCIELTPKITCRIGGFVEYALPIAKDYKTKEIVDYSQLDGQPYTLSQDNLKANIRFNSIQNGCVNALATAGAGENLFKGWSQYLSFGVRATFRFDVTQTPAICRCYLGY